MKGSGIFLNGNFVEKCVKEVKNLDEFFIPFNNNLISLINVPYIGIALQLIIYTKPFRV